MTTSIIISPLIPLLWLAILCALALIGTILVGWYSPIWLGLRISLIAVVGVIALGLERIEAEHEYLSDIALLVIDDSSSMQMGKRTEVRDQMLETIRNQIEAISDLELLEATVTDSVQGTRLFDSLSSGIDQIPQGRLAGIITLSDGIIHDTAPAKLPDTPLHAMIIGNPNTGDRALKIIEAPKFGIVSEAVSFKIRVDDFGQEKSASAVIVLQLSGEQELRTRVQTGIDVTVNMPLTSRGSNLVEISVEPATEELTLNNNRAVVEITGVRERLRVLLVSGEPYAGVRAWRNLLKSDPAVDLVHFTILRPPTKRDATPLNEMALIAFPTRELFVNKLQSFDLVIFDRYTRRGVLPLLYLENVARYVENGGALMVAAGPPFAGNGSLANTFLAGVLPARPDANIHTQPFKPQITTIGERHPVTSGFIEQQDNWGRWGRVIGVNKISGETVLSAGEEKPLLILDRVSNGRVALLLSDQAWLWSRGFENGGPQFELYRRLAHWLMKEPELEEEALRAKVNGGQLQVRLQTLAKDPPVIEVQSADGQSWQLQLKNNSAGVFTGSINMPENIGMLTLKAGGLLAVATQGRLNPPELANLKPDAKILGSLAKATNGGQFILADTDQQISLRRTRPQDRQKGRNWIGLQQNKFSIQTNTTSRPLLAYWVYLLLILALFAMMWLREKKQN
ncbi:MAG: hypothetical protein JKY46_06610 [Robiginitomaculum sp.]|nr:hypothetical protein [Robiginitomaculum sp.]